MTTKTATAAVVRTSRSTAATPKWRSRCATCSEKYAAVSPTLPARFSSTRPTRRRREIDVTIQAASIDTAEAQRDQHLRSADFFDVDSIPTLTFKSTSVTPHGNNAYDVVGDLSIHGVTKRVTMPASFLGVARDPWGNEKFGFEAELTINRKDYGLLWNAALETGGFLVGDEVKIMLSCKRNKPSHS